MIRKILIAAALVLAVPTAASAWPSPIHQQSFTTKVQVFVTWHGHRVCDGRTIRYYDVTTSPWKPQFATTYCGRVLIPLQSGHVVKFDILDLDGSRNYMVPKTLSVPRPMIHNGVAIPYNVELDIQDFMP